MGAKAHRDKRTVKIPFQHKICNRINIEKKQQKLLKLNINYKI